jgi:hypothetical protein
MNHSLFPNGRFKGSGEWVDKKGERGKYTSAFEIIDAADHCKEQITHREFLNADGSLLYEENSIISIKIFDNHFAEVSIRHNENEVAGQGYWFANALHYDLDVSQDTRLENTYVFSGDGIELLGSATNKDNFTVWSERLDRVG